MYSADWNLFFEGGNCLFFLFKNGKKLKKGRKLEKMRERGKKWEKLKKSREKVVGKKSEKWEKWKLEGKKRETSVEKMKITSKSEKNRKKEEKIEK